jgi:hypothetical protein
MRKCPQRNLRSGGDLSWKPDLQKRLNAVLVVKVQNRVVILKLDHNLQLLQSKYHQEEDLKRYQNV